MSLGYPVMSDSRGPGPARKENPCRSQAPHFLASRGTLYGQSFFSPESLHSLDVARSTYLWCNLLRVSSVPPPGQYRGFIMQTPWRGGREGGVLLGVCRSLNRTRSGQSALRCCLFASLRAGYLHTDLALFLVSFFFLSFGHSIAL